MDTSFSTLDIFKNSLLDQDDFTITFELVPGRGSGGKQIDNLLNFAHEVKQDGQVKALSITDNPGGHPAIAPSALGLEIKKIGIEPLIHFSLKDKNRNMAESQLFEYYRHKLSSILVLGGDFPHYGYSGQPLPVFDLDSVQLLDLVNRLKKGFSINKSAPGNIMGLPPMNYLAGCVVSPFKTTKEEQIWQYIKLEKKINAGADFIITQLGFDLAKYKEIITFCKKTKITKPLIANVFIPNLPVARAMHAGKVPGVILDRKLLTIMEDENNSRDNGNKARLIRGAQTIATLKRLGYAGVHIGGSNINYDNLCFLLDKTNDYSNHDKQNLANIDFPAERTWYMFEDNSTQTKSSKKIHLQYNISNFVHNNLFQQNNFISQIFKRISIYCSTHKTLLKLYINWEKIIKFILFNCKMCGDCTLSTSSYLCPQSGCPKKMINGPCGGSINGLCEVDKDKQCFWVLVYREQPNKISSRDNKNFLSPKDWSLQGTSSWINFFMNRN